MNALISVIIPIYKVELYLDECIQSIVNQTYTNLEIILVDDGSPDKCPQMCDEWAKKDSRIKVIHKQNGGLSDARNAGLDIAKGDFIAFVDSDDWILPAMYERMLSVISKEKADICACNIRSCFSDREIEWGCSEQVVGNSELIFKMLYDDTKYPVSAWNKLYTKECWNELRFPVGKICEDAFTTYQLIHYANKIVQIPEAYYCYRIRSESIMTSSFSKKRMDEEGSWRMNYEFIQSHYPSLYKNAYDFYLLKVNVLIHALTLEDRMRFKDEYEYLYSILKKNIFYILFLSKLNIKSRIKFILDYIKL